MKALSIWQPYASLLASGRKRFETRGWSTRYRGLVAVHAGLKRVERADEFLLAHDLDHLLPLPYGAIVGVVELIECRSTGTAREPAPWVSVLSDFEAAVGDFDPMRYGWRAASPVLFRDPIPMRGRQGLFDLPPEFEAEVLKRLKGEA